ncbi:MAG: DUF1905 domain-containing protein [Chitinophagales bacterium]|nr:DUF1905 domain-containing protein [Chitinophagales bacterium]
MPPHLQYSFSAQVWQYNPPAGWFFVSLPLEIAKEIRENAGWQEEGWGRLKTTARIGKTEWKTAIWFDTKKRTYLLPLKAEIRKKENAVAGKKLTLTIWV